MKYTTLASSSSGNSVFVSTGKTKILVDAGISCKKIVDNLKEIGESIYDVDGIFITHEHSDHIKGVATLCKKYGIPVFASPKTILELEQMVPENLRNTFSYGMKFGDFQVDFLELSHDAVEPVGFILRHDGVGLGIATDTGVVSRAMANKLETVQGLVIEANHNLEMLDNGPYPQFLRNRVRGNFGHLSNAQAGELISYLAQRGKIDVTLAHLSESNNTPSQALNDVKKTMENYGCNEDVNLKVAPAGIIGKTIIL